MRRTLLLNVTQKLECIVKESSKNSVGIPSSRMSCSSKTIKWELILHSNKKTCVHMRVFVWELVGTRVPNKRIRFWKRILLYELMHGFIVALVSSLVIFPSHSHNTEKVIYFLLLDRKKRRPACEDDAELTVRTQRNDNADPPKKRIDTLKVNGPGTTQYQLSQGSPIIARRQVYK